MAAGSMHFQCLYKAGKPLHMLRSSMAKCRSNYPPCMIYSMTIMSIKETFACCYIGVGFQTTQLQSGVFLKNPNVKC